MNLIMQTRFGDDGNCLAACLASVLEFDIELIPEFNQTEPNKWFKELNAWLLNFNLGLLRIPSMPQEDYLACGLDPIHLITGPSPRGRHTHCVVGQQGRVIHDPHPDKTGLLDGAWNHYLFVAML